MSPKWGRKLVGRMSKWEGPLADPWRQVKIHTERVVSHRDDQGREGVVLGLVGETRRTGGLGVYVHTVKLHSDAAQVRAMSGPPRQQVGRPRGYRVDGSKQRIHRSCLNWYITMDCSSDLVVFATVGGHIAVGCRPLVQRSPGNDSHSSTCLYATKRVLATCAICQRMSARTLNLYLPHIPQE